MGRTESVLSGLCLCWLSYTSLEGTERDPRQTQRQDVEAIQQGLAGAQYNLGNMYADENDAEAGRW